MKYKIIIPDTPCPLNRLLSMCWGARKRVKGRFNRAVWAGVHQSDLPKGFQDVPKKVHVDTTFFWPGTRGRTPDGDNLLKHYFDSLKDNGVIHDDSQKYLSWSQPVIKRDPNNPRIEITLTVLEDEVYCCGCGFTHKPGECPDGLKGKR